MEEKTSKISQIISTKEVDTTMGKMLRSAVKLENGDEGAILKNSGDGISVGAEITYIIKEKNGFKNIIEKGTKKKNSGGFNNNTNVQLIVCAMQCATQLVNNGTVEFGMYKENFDVLFEWMKKKYEGE